MALDNAQFIAELSITDPPGTDPLSQGDDQIRTIKRATQQSFPNIDAAVTLTTAQMNLAAIKNENNIFTVDQTFQANILLDATADIIKAIDYQVSGLNRWSLRMQNVAGSNNFELSRFDVLGVFVDNPWNCDLSTGIVDFAQVPTVQGAPLWIAGEIRQFVAVATPGTNWFKADGTNGTVNLIDRSLVADGTSVPGTLLNPNLVGTAAAGTTGGTAITEAQMPAHNHTVWITNNSAGGITDININTTDNVFGGRRNDSSKQFSKSNGTRDLVGDAGSGSAHTHSSPSQAVTENGTSRDTVRPLSAVVQYHQYVP
jgi:hypothetical protein